MESVYQFVVRVTLSVSQTIFAQNVTRHVTLARRPQLHVSVVYKISLRTSIMLSITHAFRIAPMDSIPMRATFVKLVVGHAQHVWVIQLYVHLVLQQLFSIQLQILVCLQQAVRLVPLLILL